MYMGRIIKQGEKGKREGNVREKEELKAQG
jgi:hypothetical protein